MTQHLLQGRTDSELLWTRRRGFLQAAAAWTAMGGIAGAQAQSRSNVVALSGDALLNGQRLTTQQTIQTGDRVDTGPGSNLVFVVGNDSFQLRQNSSMVVERGASLFAVSVLRLISGGVASVWGAAGAARSSRRPSRPASAALASTPKSSPTRTGAVTSATVTARWKWAPAPTGP